MHLVAILFGLSSVADAAPLEIKVTDPAVIAVVLECGSVTHKSLVRLGVASFGEAPKSACEVTFVRKSGVVGGPGKWTCGLDDCVQEDIHFREVTNAPGRANIIVSAAVDPSAQLEVTCPNGYRERASIIENVATFDGLPSEACVLHFKGGTPARYNGLRSGTYQCSLTGTTAVCTQR